MTNNTTELKPCPMCNGSGTIVHFGGPDDGDSFCEPCPNCAPVNSKVNSSEAHGEPSKSVSELVEETLASGASHRIEGWEPSKAAPTGFDAEFLSNRLGRVAKLAGVPMPDMTHEQIAECAGTILGSIASMLETSKAGSAEQVSDNRALFEAACNGVFDLTREIDAWGRPRYANSHIQAMFDGFEIGRKSQTGAALQSAPERKALSDDTLPTLPQSLINLIGEYGMARTDGLNQLEVQHKWLSLIGGIKDYARALPAQASAQSDVPERDFGDMPSPATLNSMESPT